MKGGDVVARVGFLMGVVAGMRRRRGDEPADAPLRERERDEPTRAEREAFAVEAALFGKLAAAASMFGDTDDEDDFGLALGEEGADDEGDAEPDMTAIVGFIEAMAEVDAPLVIELGTRRQEGQERTRHNVWVPHAREYVGVDYEPGDDVDVVADAHALSRHFAAESVDAVVACSIFEHIKYPWIAAAEIAKILKPGGHAFIHTHQTFALHAHPHDYWRFSTAGLSALFPPTLGFEILACHYQYPCRIVTAADPLQARNPSYLNVCLLARKVGPAPAEFVPDFGR